MNNIDPFNFEEQEEFDQHINLSIPNYKSLDCIFSHIAKEFSQPDSVTVDLGCSTGRFLNNLPKVDNCKYIGIDKVNMKTFDGFKHIVGDCEDVLNELADVGVISSMFFLQFLGSIKRQKTLKAIKRHIDKGSIFLVAEKVYLDDTRLQTLLHRMHIQKKRENFTDSEILDKDNQLSVSMFCKTESELINELTELGRVTPVWQSYNFLGYVVQSKEYCSNGR